MKKCPNCAEKIQDGVIICRFCGRDLQKIYSVLNLDTRVEFTEKDFNNILETWAKSWENNPGNKVDRDIVEASLVNLFSKISGIFIENKIINHQIFETLSKQFVSKVYLCQFLSYAIGVENAAGFIENDIAKNLAYMYFTSQVRKILYNLIDDLQKNELIYKSMNKELKMESEAGLAFFAFQAVDNGRLHYREIIYKNVINGKTPFQNAILELKAYDAVKEKISLF